MRKIYILMCALLMQGVALFGQTYLAPEEGYRVAGFLSDYTQIGAFDIKGDRVYIQDGDTIHAVNALTGEELGKYGEPTDYQVSNYASFLTISPDEKSIWTGYTSDGNADDRIYSIDMESGVWTLKAKFPGNYDLIFWRDSILVSGLNSATWGDPNGIYLLDTSGLDQHRLIVEVGGNSAGMAIDTLKNLYYGTSYSLEPNAIYRWTHASLEAVIGTVSAAPLQLADGQKLTDVPAGISDCEIDEGFNLIFTMNLFGSPKVLGMWNGSWEGGDGYLLDTLAVAAGEWDWLGSVKSMGDFTTPYIGERLLTFSFGQPLVDLHTANYPPVVTAKLPVLSGYENRAIDTLDLLQFVADPDEKDAFSFSMEDISNPIVANLHINDHYLVGTLAEMGQSNVLILAAAGEQVLELRTTVGTWPRIEGEQMVSDMDELILDPESYWNGSDGSGAFNSAAVRFHNSYNADWFSWSGWANSSVTDNTSPGWMNQYSAFTGKGFDGSNNYAVGYATTPAVLDFTEDKAFAVEGFFVTNSTYAGLSMSDGDDFTKKFGGDEGTDPDFFRLDLWGARDGNDADTLSFYLADFRSENSFEDYIVNTWQWVDLSSLGKVDSLQFALSSSDMGDWGMNTPGYFCLDNLYVIPDAVPYVKNPQPDITILGDGSDTVIDLSTLFSDPDDGDEAVALSILSNSNENILEASISGSALTLRGDLQIVKAGSEPVELVIEGVSGGLSVTDDFVVSIDIVDGLGMKGSMELSIYPNPSKSSITIQAQTNELLDVTILSITGSTLYQNPAFEAGETIDISGLSMGPYVVRIVTEKGTVNKMIQKL
jgi:hypothetical protein